ncbi:MAG: hypothetical protein Q7K25_03295 [Actinomycetota bacterium]|nr:hypothetical protein [Actinomycetota bacterium]
MISTRVRKSTLIASMAALGLVALSGCMNINYSLNVNADATLSGSIELSVAKQAAGILGIDSPEDLNSKLRSGDLTDQAAAENLQSCVSSEDAENYILKCQITNATASDISENWSMTTDGDIATFSATSDASANSSSVDLPGISQGGFELTLTFPGEISSVTGEGAVKTGPNTVTSKGSLEDSMNITVVGSLNDGSSSMLWIYILLGVLALAAIAVLGFVLRSGSRNANTVEQPAVEGADEAVAIQAAPQEPIAPSETGDQQ